MSFEVAAQILSVFSILWASLLHASSRMNEESAAVREVIDAIADGVRRKDVEAILAHCAPEIVAFDLLPPSKHEGIEAVRRSWSEGLAMTESPNYSERDHKIVAGSDVAIVLSINSFGGRELRSTLGLRKTGGRWKVVHQHVSSM